MLISGVLKFDPQGRIIVSTDFPADFNGGTPIAADGSLSVAVGATPDVHLAAIGYLNLGRLTDSDNPLTPHTAPITNDQGQVRVSFGLPAFYYAGLPLTAEGFLSISGGDPPVDIGEFDFGFDQAFDIGI
jgi:hypothetical protein